MTDLRLLYPLIPGHPRHRGLAAVRPRHHAPAASPADTIGPAPTAARARRGLAGGGLVLPADAWGVGVVQGFGDLGIDAYAMYQKTDEIGDEIMGGLRIKF